MSCVPRSQSLPRFMPGNFHALASWKQKQREIDKRVSNMKEKERQMHEDHHASMKAHDAMLEADDEVGFVPGADKTRVMGAAWDKINQEEYGLLTPRTVTGERRVMIKDFQRRCDDRREDMRAADSAYHAHLRDYTERVLELDTEAACVDDSEKVKTQYGSRIVTPHVKMNVRREADFNRRKEERYRAMWDSTKNLRILKENIEKELEEDDEIGCCPCKLATRVLGSGKIELKVLGVATDPVTERPNRDPATGKEMIHEFKVQRVLSDGVIKGNRLLAECRARAADEKEKMTNATQGYFTDGAFGKNGGWEGRWGVGWQLGPGLERIDRALEGDDDAGCIPGAHKEPPQPDIADMTLETKKEYLGKRVPSMENRAKGWPAKMVTPQLIESLANQKKWKQQYHENVRSMREKTLGYFTDGRAQTYAAPGLGYEPKGKQWPGLGRNLNGNAGPSSLPGTVLFEIENDPDAACIDNAKVLNMDAPLIEQRISTEYTRDQRRKDNVERGIRRECKRDMTMSTREYHSYVKSLRNRPFYYTGSKPAPLLLD